MKNVLLILSSVLLFVGCATNNNGTVTVVPIAPTNLTGTVTSTTQVDLSWTDNSTNEQGFKIERKTGSGTYSVVGSTGVNITTFSDLGLTPNTTYTYRVYAYNNAGNSLQYSNEVTVTTQDNIPTWLTNGLVAYYPFSGNAGDSSGNGNHGTVNGATLTTDRFGNSNKAYDFNGINNSIVVPNSQTLNIIGNQISISYWMNFRNNIADGNYQGISKGGWDVGSGYELIFRYSYLGDPNNTGAVCLNSSNGGFNSEGINSYQNTWVNITSTFENGTQNTYYNGILQNTISAGAGIVTFYSNTNNLYIGTRDPQNGYVGFLDGKMDDIRIYNRALSQSEVTYLATH